MKILQVITSLKTGGAEKLLTDIVPLLQSKGHEVDLCLFDGINTEFKQDLLHRGVRIIEFGYDCNVYNPIFAFKLLLLMKNYDIVHTHNTAPQIFATLGSYFSPCKLVTTEHSTSTRRRKYPLFRFIDKWMYSRYHQIICISKPSEDNLRNYIGESYPIVTIHNGVDVKKFTEAKPVNLGFDHCIKITMVAGFRYEKDQPTLIKALNFLPENYHVFLVGDGVKRPVLESLIENENLSDRVHLLGIRNDVPSILKSSDIVVMSSHREGLSLSNVEGMCSGKPFIASDVEGLREVTKDYGLLFPHEDSKALADLIQSLVKEPDYAKRIAIRCMKRAAQYDIQNMVTAYNQIYLKQIEDEQ